MTVVSVYPRGKKWAVRKNGAKRALVCLDSKDDALFLAKCLSATVNVFGPDGRLAERFVQ